MSARRTWLSGEATDAAASYEERIWGTSATLRGRTQARIGQMPEPSAKAHLRFGGPSP